MVLFSVSIGSESQPDTELAELYRHRARVGAALNHRHRELAADQETGFLPVGGDQVRLRQNLQHALVLERLMNAARFRSGRKAKMFSASES